MMPKITIGTRAYNSENYIRKCIESVLNQTFTDFEYFIIDNGSTDRTRAIINEYAEQDKRIKAIYLDRNDPSFSLTKILVERGKGEFFTDFDSDDWLEVTFLEELYNGVLFHKADIGICGSIFHFEEDNTKAYRQVEGDYVIITEDIPAVFPYLYQFMRTTWGKIVRADIVRNTWNCRNESGYHLLTYGGDTYLCFEFLKRTQKVYLSDKVLHNYLVHKYSSSYKFDANRVFSDKFLFYHVESFLQNFGQISEKNYEMLYLVYACALTDTLKVIVNAKLTIEKKIIQLKKIFNDELTKKLLLNYKKYSEVINLKKQMAVFIYKNSQFNFRNKKFLDIIYSLNSEIKEYDLDIILSSITKEYPILLSFLLLNKYDEIIVLIEKEKRQDNLLNDLKFILKFEKASDSGGKLNLCEKYLRERGRNNVIKAKLSKLAKENFLLEYCHLDGSFCMDFFELSKFIIYKNYMEALEILSGYLVNNKVLEGELKKNVIELFINLSALSNNEDAFIIGQKLLIKYYIDIKENKEAERIIHEYEGILNADQDIEEFKEITSGFGGNKNDI